MSEEDSKLLHEAAKSGNTSELTRLLDESVNYENNFFQVLTEASSEGNEECVRLLMNKAQKDYSSPSDIMGLRGYSCAPLTAAIKSCNSDVVQILMQLYCKAKGTELGHAFAMASELQDTKCLEIITDKISNENHQMLDEAGHDGMPPIHMAIKNKNLKALEVLLKAGADPDIEPKLDVCGFTEWETRSYDVSRVLAAYGIIEDPGHDKNEMRFRDLPLHYAARCGNMMAVEMLLRFGANPGVLNGVQEVPIVVAIRTSHIDCVKVLSVVTPPTLNSQAVVEAAMDRNLDCLECLFKQGYTTFTAQPDDCDVITDWQSILFPQSWSSEVKPGNPDEELAKTVRVLFKNKTNFYEIATSKDFFLPMFFHENILRTFKVFCDFGLLEMHCDCELFVSFVTFLMSFEEIIRNYIDMQRELDYDALYAQYLENPDLISLDPLRTISIFMDHFPFAILNSDNVPLKNLHEGLTPVVPSLKNLCRWTIRCSIILEHDLISEELVSKLSLPKALKNFIIYR